MANNNVRILYQYIAATDPYFARRVCVKYGYTVPPVKNEKELGALLQELVSIEGEPAFRDIMQHHPDKDLILEMYGEEGVPHKVKIISADGNTDEEKPCKCKSCNHDKPAGFLNADAATIAAAATVATQNNNAAHHQVTSTQTGVIILSCAVIIALAIMSKK